MGDPIAPDVDTNLQAKCSEDTLLSRHGEDPVIEVHNPYPDTLVKRGLPLLAVLHRQGDTVSVKQFGHLNYSGLEVGLPSVDQLRRHVDDDPFYAEELSSGEKQFVRDLIMNQYSDGRSPFESCTLAETTFTQNWLIGVTDPDGFRETAKTIDPEKDYHTLERGPDTTTHGRRNELVNSTITLLRDFASTIADVPSEGTYLVRAFHFYDFYERAKDLYLEAPALTQKQAVIWALLELGLDQTSTAELRGVSQPTVRKHARTVAKEFANATRTRDAFGSLPDYAGSLNNIVGDVDQEIEEEIADERFRLEKEKQAIFAKCRQCGLDAGEWEGTRTQGDWVGEPTEFWVGRRLSDRVDVMSVQCPECGHTAHRNEFDTQWKQEHGQVEDDRPAPY